MINPAKTKSLQNIEQKMENMDPDSLRYSVLKKAKDFKTSWIELGQLLYTVFKDKLYKEWGYGSFDAYAAREIGIRKQTAMKLLRSYCFLEKEEPLYLNKDYVESSDAANIPSYESVDLLRQAKNKHGVDEQDYAALKKEVFEKGRDASEVRKGLVAIVRQRQEFEPEEARRKRKIAVLKRFVGILKSLKDEIETARLAPASLIKEAAVLIAKFEAEIK